MITQMKNYSLLLFALCSPLIAQGAFVVDAGEKGNFLFEADNLALVSTIDLTIHTGSVQDPPGKEGLTDLALDLVLRGTKNKTRDQFATAVEGLGATIQSKTGFAGSAISLTTISENLEPAMKLLSEAIQEPGLRPQDFANLKSEAIGKLEQARSRVAGMVFRAARQTLYKGTPLAHNPDGTIESLKRITLKDVQDQLKRMLVNGNITIAVNTNRPQDQVRAWIERDFAMMATGPLMVKPALAQPKLKGRHLVIVERKGMTVANTAIVHPSLASDNPLAVEIELASFILGGDMSSRLFTVLRKENGWTYGAYSGFQLMDFPRRYGSAYAIYTYPAMEHALQAIPKAVEMYSEFYKTGLNQKELDFGKNALVNSYAFNFVSAAARLNGRIYERFEGFPYLAIEEYSSRIKSLSLSTYNQTLKDAFDPENLIIVVAGDPAFLRTLQKSIPDVKDVTVIKDPVQRIN